MKRLFAVAQSQNLTDPATAFDSRPEAVVDEIDRPAVPLHTPWDCPHIAAKAHSQHDYRYIKKICHFLFPLRNFFDCVRILMGNYIDWRIYRKFSLLTSL
jgi:hypothetical protein